MLPEHVRVPLGESLVVAVALLRVAAARERRQDAESTRVAVEVPRAPVQQVIVEGVGAVLLRDPDVADAAVHAVGEREVDEPVVAGERERRFGAPRGERTESPTGTAGEHEGEDPGTWHAHGPAQGPARGHGPSAVAVGLA